IFYQSDIRHQGVWIDKGYLVMRAAEAECANLVWHKIACRLPAGTSGLGRASYSHMLCFTREMPKPMRVPSADVLADAGAMSWSRAMGAAACQLACRYLRDETSTRRVVDPFCGRGHVLAVASSLGFEVVGIDLSAKRCRAARAAIESAVPQGDALRRGARLFNDGRFFEAHEAWEDRWRAATDEIERRFLQGLIQVAAAFHKLFVMDDVAAALRLLARGLAKLDACPERVAAVDLTAFRSAIRGCASALARGELARDRIPRIECDDRS
ncbi:MAG TPA: DUF309 domain-containing protein, partial [Polyangiales bacterium]|nr:DUF309 domain-containing protein [Polyangiales bacterium]